jgi:nicotinate-nucleotide pyrophosphorylase (carboxylating)
LAEDLGPGDITSQSLVDGSLCAKAVILAKQEGILAGMFILQDLAKILAQPLQIEPRASDAQALSLGQKVVQITGPACQILAIERVALNFIAHLSGIATLVNKFVREVQPSSAIICDTRKTTPGLRALEKYAVLAGGGTNHRLGLYDAAMIKDNHLLCLSRDSAALVSLAQRLEKLREQLPPQGFIELEVDDLSQFQHVLDVRLDVDMVLLDNFSQTALAQAVKLRDQAGLAGKLLLEASGNISLENVKQVANSGVDRISVGALTHSAPALDFSMEFALK